MCCNVWTKPWVINVTWQKYITFTVPWRQQSFVPHVWKETGWQELQRKKNRAGERENDWRLRVLQAFFKCRLTRCKTVSGQIQRGTGAVLSCLQTRRSVKHPLMETQCCTVAIVMMQTEKKTGEFVHLVCLSHFLFPPSWFSCGYSLQYKCILWNHWKRLSEKQNSTDCVLSESPLKLLILSKLNKSGVVLTDECFQRHNQDFKGLALNWSPPTHLEESL